VYAAAAKPHRSGTEEKKMPMQSRNTGRKEYRKRCEGDAGYRERSGYPLMSIDELMSSDQ
jgi:hypothetical protein